MRTKTVRKRTGCGTAYITVTEPGEPTFHLRCQLGKTGGCAAAHMEALSKVVTEAVNAGVLLETICKHLSGISCPHGGGLDLSCPDAVAKVLKGGGDA